MVARSGEWDRAVEARVVRRWPRSVAERVVQGEEVKAVRAAATALETSVGVAAWTEQMGSSVLGGVSGGLEETDARGRGGG